MNVYIGFYRKYFVNKIFIKLNLKLCIIKNRVLLNGTINAYFTNLICVYWCLLHNSFYE